MATQTPYAAELAERRKRISDGIFALGQVSPHPAVHLSADELNTALATMRRALDVVDGQIIAEVR